MQEWLNWHAWKACVRATVPRVRIPLSPPVGKRNENRLRFGVREAKGKENKDYIHRVGRAGRAGKTGYAYTFVAN